jgi:hypothetical protein
MRHGPVVRAAISFFVVALLIAAAGANSDKTASTTTLRWEEGRPGCTFSRDDDGKYRYGFWTADFGIVLAVDSQELEKVRRRAQPILALQLTLHYRGKDSLDVAPSKISLEFVKHYHDLHSALDPGNFAGKEQEGADALAAETQREINKHPEKKAEKEARSQARQKDAADMIDFLNTRTLPALTLKTDHSEATGWVLFTVKSKWIAELQKQERT